MTAPKDYSFIHKLPWKEKSVIDGILEVIQSKDKEIEELNTKLNTALNFHSALPFKPYLYNTEEISKKVWTESYYLQKAPRLTIEQLEEYRKKDLITYEENVLIAAENMKSHVLVMTFLLRIGLKKTKWEVKRRGANKSEVPCLWVGEVAAAFPSNAKGYWDIVDNSYKRHTNEIQEYYKKKEEEKLKVAKDVAAQKEQSEKLKLLAALAVRYDYSKDLDFPTPKELLDHLLSLNKYLRLAHYLYLNRCDWNDGYSYAKEGILGFAPDCSMDNEIIDDVSSYFDDFNDGRCWRNSDWNYDRLFALAAEQNNGLYKDYQELRNYCAETF